MTTRRQFLAGAAALCATRPSFAVAPTAPVAVAKCPSYGAELLPALQKMFDQLGGLDRIVKNKTVAIKVNLTGTANSRLGYLPIEDTTWTHPAVIGATISLLGRAGARRIRVLESPWKSAEPLEEYMLDAGWEPRDLLNAASNVEFENTNFLGRGRNYVRIPVPNGGHMFKSFDLNHSCATSSAEGSMEGASTLDQSVGFAMVSTSTGFLPAVTWCTDSRSTR